MAFVACGAKILTLYALRLANQIFMMHTAKVLKHLQIFHVLICVASIQAHVRSTYACGSWVCAACKTHVKRAAKQMMLISCETTKAHNFARQAIMLLL